MAEKLYWSIREVAAEVQLPEPTLRYYEKEFESLCPKKTATGIRQYTRKDIDEILLIKSLVKERGLTLAAAKKALRESRRKISAQAELRRRLEAVRDELLAIRNGLA